MKHTKTSSSTFIFLLLVAGIIFSIFSVHTGHGRQPDITLAKSSVVDHNSGSTEGQKFFSEVSPSLSTTYFEPLLLFMLGTILLSIVTGINLLRARKIEFPLHSVGRADLLRQAKFGGRKPPADKNEAA